MTLERASAATAWGLSGPEAFEQKEYSRDPAVFQVKGNTGCAGAAVMAADTATIKLSSILE